MTKPSYAASEIVQRITQWASGFPLPYSSVCELVDESPIVLELKKSLEVGIRRINMSIANAYELQANGIRCKTCSVVCKQDLSGKSTARVQHLPDCQVQQTIDDLRAMSVSLDKWEPK